MNRALLGITGLCLTACGAQAAKQYDMPQVEKNFMACMNATPPATSPLDFRSKVDACQESAWASAKQVK